MASEIPLDLELESAIKKISEDIGLGWCFLARSLGFTQTDVDAIEYAYPRNLKEQIHQFFYQWKRRDGEEATYDKLYAALVHSSLTSLLEPQNKSQDKSIEKGERAATPPNFPIQESTPPRTPPPTLPSAPPSAQVSTPTPITPPTQPPLLQSTPLDSNAERDSTNTTTELTPSRSAQQSRNFVTPANDLNREEGETEFVRRKRLERFASNWSNNSALSDSGSSDVQRQTSQSSVPETPPSTVNNSLQPAPEPSSPPQPRPPPQPHPLCPFELDDVVMVERPDAAPWYGVIKWIGDLPGHPGEPVAGIEMEDEVPGGGDGSINGERLFQCPDRHGLFLPMARIKRDNRFNVDSSQDTPQSVESNAASNTASSESGSSNLPGLDEVLKPFLFTNAPPSRSSSETQVNSGEEKVLVFTVPADHAGLVIGRDGRNIREVELATNTIIKMERDYGPGLGGNKRGVIRGSEENQKKALQMILNRLKKRVDLHTAKVETIQIPEDKVGLVIGRGGQTINAIKTLSGVVDIKIDDRTPGLASFSLFAPSTRSCTITGSEKDIEKAKQLIDLAAKGGNIVVGATLAALIADLANLGVEVEESDN